MIVRKTLKRVSSTVRDKKKKVRYLIVEICIADSKIYKTNQTTAGGLCSHTNES